MKAREGQRSNGACFQRDRGPHASSDCQGVGKMLLTSGSRGGEDAVSQFQPGSKCAAMSRHETGAYHTHTDHTSAPMNNTASNLKLQDSIVELSCLLMSLQVFAMPYGHGAPAPG
eukprot:4111698-Amphidinium_carterae.1